MNLTKVKRIDIGCGKPEQKYRECFGLDVNKAYHPDLLHSADDGLPFKTNQLEFINSDNSLEHFKNSYFVLSECYRVLKKGGKMRLVVPNMRYFPLTIINLFVDVGWFWNWYMNLSFKKARSIHQILLTRHMIELMAKNIGFKIEKVNGFGYSKEIELILRK